MFDKIDSFLFTLSRLLIPLAIVLAAYAVRDGLAEQGRGQGAVGERAIQRSYDLQKEELRRLDPGRRGGLEQGGVWMPGLETPCL